MAKLTPAQWQKMAKELLASKPSVKKSVKTLSKSPAKKLKPRITGEKPKPYYVENEHKVNVAQFNALKDAINFAQEKSIKTGKVYKVYKR